MDLTSIKERFGIIGNDTMLNRAIEIATKVAGTDLSVLVTGESGVGKESIPQIIHQFSPRKHALYIAVNCGAIPEGTIDSELFGHEKGSFTGATEARKGYFEVADGGTIFLDEVAELPLPTQARLLRVLQNGDFMRVGSSKVQKCNVRVVAATNVNLKNAIHSGKFREDLYYRLNTVPIVMPALRDRNKEDIYLLFRKFVLDFSDKYKMPAIKLDPQAKELLENYRWPGNIRQLKNVAEQMSVLEQNRVISAGTLRSYLPAESDNTLPVPAGDPKSYSDFISERDLFNRVLLKLQKEVEEMRSELNALKGREFLEIPRKSTDGRAIGYGQESFKNGTDNNPNVVVTSISQPDSGTAQTITHIPEHMTEDVTPVIIQESKNSLSIQDASEELIKKALEKHHGKRKAAAQELGISERTLYRKLKDLK